ARHILPYFDQTKLAGKEPSKYVFDLGNGISNSLYPIMNALKSDQNAFLKESMPAALRAIYSFETWVAVRKLYRHQEKSNEAIEAMFKKLFSIDLEQTRLVPTCLFEADPEEPVFSDAFEINDAYFEELYQKFSYVDGIHLMVPVLSIIENDQLRLQNLPSNIAQALLYPTKADSTDESTTSMILPDVVDPVEGVSMIQKRVRELHAERREQDTKTKAANEFSTLTNELVEKLVASTDYNEFCNMLREGLTRGASSTKSQIDNPATPCFTELQDRLWDLDANIPLQVDKIRTLSYANLRASE
ncbi:UNVERIFIED_CONTAM: hypothetical protein HDU68_001800, partial [Siphonaria sp. JEL0065]